jgi:hypothetical protein
MSVFAVFPTAEPGWKVQASEASPDSENSRRQPLRVQTGMVEKDEAER